MNRPTTVAESLVQVGGWIGYLLETTSAHRPRRRRRRRPRRGNTSQPPVRRHDLRIGVPRRPPYLRGPVDRAGSRTRGGITVRGQRADHPVRQPRPADPATADQPVRRRILDAYRAATTGAAPTNTSAIPRPYTSAKAPYPDRPGTADIALLDALPYLTLHLADAPEPLLRRLFEITQLDIRSHNDRDQVTITITLPADQLPDIAHAAGRITNIMPPTQQTPAHTAEVACVDAVRAPSRTRTDTVRILSPLPLPIGLWGRPG